MPKERALAAGDMITLQFGSVKGVFQNNFATRSGGVVAVPLGTVLRFPSGFMVRQYDESGSGSWGMVQEPFWTVTLYQRGKEIGLLLPAGTECNTYTFREADGGTRKETSRERVEERFVTLKRVDTPHHVEVRALPTAIPSRVTD